MTKIKNDSPRTIYKDVYPREPRKLSPQVFMALSLVVMLVSFTLVGLLLGPVLGL